MTNFYEITVETTELYSELVGDLLTKFGCKGIVLSEMYFSETYTHKNMPCVKGYIAEQLFDEDKRLKLLGYLDEQKELINISEELSGNWKTTFKLVQEEDWAESWKNYWHPERIGENIVICPSWENFNEKMENDIIITLDPGSAFGTGSHQTTRLCIRAIEKLLKQYSFNNLIDVGTGSGILAIVAAKMGITKITGIDIDPVSVDVAKVNAQENSVSSICTFTTDSIRKIKEEYDLVIVNILAKTIIAMAEDIKRITKTGGMLVISGLIKTSVDNVKDTFISLGYDILEINSEDEWYAIIARK